MNLKPLDFVCCRSAFPINWCYMSAEIVMRRYKCIDSDKEWLEKAVPGEFRRFGDDLIFCTTPVEQSAKLAVHESLGKQFRELLQCE